MIAYHAPPYFRIHRYNRFSSVMAFFLQVAQPFSRTPRFQSLIALKLAMQTLWLAPMHYDYDFTYAAQCRRLTHSWSCVCTAGSGADGAAVTASAAICDAQTTMASWRSCKCGASWQATTFTGRHVGSPGWDLWPKYCIPTPVSQVAAHSLLPGVRGVCGFAFESSTLSGCFARVRRSRRGVQKCRVRGWYERVREPFDFFGVSATVAIKSAAVPRESVN